MISLYILASLYFLSFICCQKTINWDETTLEEIVSSIKAADDKSVGDDFYYGYDAEDLADMNGFILQHYDITTEDGYILDLWRLNDSVDSLFDYELAERTPIVISPGLGCDGTIFMNNQRENSVAFMLYDAGYDVWIINYRGNYYSRYHETYDRDTDNDYWIFTMYEQAKYDLTASINYVLQNNDHTNLSLIGHSMGSANILILTSMYESFGFDVTKIKSVILTAPAAISENMSALNFEQIHDMEDGAAEKLVFNIFGYKSFGSHEDYGYLLSRLAYGIPNIAQEIVEWACGKDDTNAYENEDIYYYLNFYPSGTSVYSLANYLQLIKRGGFQAYDYSFVDSNLNLEHYGSSVPPTFDFNNIPTNIPILVMPGENDTMAALEDCTEVYNQLNQKDRDYLELYTVSGYNHIDFIWGTNVDTYIYPKVEEFFNTYAQDN